jgi:hypothetical protein
MSNALMVLMVTRITLDWNDLIAILRRLGSIPGLRQ